MTNKITLTAPERDTIFGIPRRPRCYVANIFINGIDSGLYGVATTPNEAARQARLKLRQLGHQSTRNRLIAMCVIADDEVTQ